MIILTIKLLTFKFTIQRWGINMRALVSAMLSIVIICIAQVAYCCNDDAPLAINKKNVINFYEEAINHKDFAAASKYLGATYKQHNPNAADGKAGLKQFIEYLKKNYPQSHSQIVQAFADGNYVILHVHSIREPGTSGRAIFDLFRLENGKIVEHWDAVQDIPKQALNANGMF